MIHKPNCKHFYNEITGSVLIVGGDLQQAHKIHGM